MTPIYYGALVHDERVTRPLVAMLPCACRRWCLSPPRDEQATDSEPVGEWSADRPLVLTKIKSSFIMPRQKHSPINRNSSPRLRKTNGTLPPTRIAMTSPTKGVIRDKRQGPILCYGRLSSSILEVYLLGEHFALVR